MSLGNFHTERVCSCLAIILLSMLTVRVVVLEYSQLHKKLGGSSTAIFYSKMDISILRWNSHSFYYACATQRECKKPRWLHVSTRPHSCVTGVLPFGSPCARPSACMLVCLGCGNFGAFFIMASELYTAYLTI